MAAALIAAVAEIHLQDLQPTALQGREQTRRRGAGQRAD